MIRHILFSIVLGVTFLGHAQSISPQSIVAEHITAVAPEAKAAATHVTLTGVLHRDQPQPGRRVSYNDDFRQLRDLCFNMERLDLSQAHIDTIPSCAFHSCHQLREIILPATLKHIERQAFYGCDGLRKVTFLGPRPTFGPQAFAQTRFQKRYTSSTPSSTTASTQLPLVPYPQQVNRLVGTFDSKAKVVASIDASLPAEGYHLHAEGKDIRIVGGDEAGVFYGRMTLDQLRISGCPAVDIVDAPRTPIRELMIDPARIFIPFDVLKDYIVEMARYKLNTLHLHLVDDQAWRLEIKAYPELTEQASFRVGMDDMLRPIGGYYTQEQMRELCEFAARYHVTIIPELELPGHEVAAIHALPWLTCHEEKLPIRTTCGVSNELLCPSRESTYGFLSTVLREMADIFPAPYVHLGGDEAGNPALDCWTTCASCQTLKEQLFLADGQSEQATATRGQRDGNWRLQQYMFDRVISLLRDTLGKTPMFWYETDFRNIQPGCITFAWRHGLTQAAIDAAKRCNAKIILCPGEHCYLDYPMDYGDMPEVNWGMPTTTLEQTYRLDPAWGNGPEFEANCLMGVAGTLWTECIPSPERLFYMTYPRALALAEAGWTPQVHRNWDGFQQRLSPIVRDMLHRGICVDWK